MPLFLLGYGGGVFAGVAVFITLLALFQHANVRLRFPVLRWVDQHARVAPLAPRDRRRSAATRTSGCPVVDKIFGTAYMPKGKRPDRLRHPLPGPADGYLQHLAYPFTAAKAPVTSVS